MAEEASVKFDADQWESYLKQVRRRWKDPEKQKEFIAIAAIAFSKDYAEHFSKSAGPEGRWKPWSDAYREHMKAIGKSGNNILIDTGRLRQSFTPSNARSQKDGVLFYNEAKTKGGFAYAAAHDEGGGKLPQRKFMWLSDKAMDDISRQVGVWLAEG